MVENPKSPGDGTIAESARDVKALISGRDRRSTCMDAVKELGQGVRPSAPLEGRAAARGSAPRRGCRYPAWWGPTRKGTWRVLKAQDGRLVNLGPRWPDPTMVGQAAEQSSGAQGGCR